MLNCKFFATLSDQHCRHKSRCWPAVQDFLTRGIIGLEQSSGAMGIAETLRKGQRLQFMVGPSSIHSEINDGMVSFTVSFKIIIWKSSYATLATVGECV